ncbi:MAG: SDR family NAD(P)-dependent oxidoreductase [Acidimicrobiales bacterium]
MDLGIAGRWAIVCASTQGLGRACAEALAAEGVNIVLNGRTPARVEEVAEEWPPPTASTCAASPAI